jgi:hypothetical protein
LTVFVKLRLFVRYRTTNVAGYDGRWHHMYMHMCVSWENTAGKAVLYKDGIVKTQTTDFRRGHVIRGGGTLVIGQDQDTVGGGFQPEESFLGDLTGINIWNRVLGPNEISTMSRVCGTGQGNVLSWSDVTSSSIRGQVQIIRPSKCRQQN